MEDYKDYYKNWTREELIEEIHEVGDGLGEWSKVAMRNYEKRMRLEEENTRLVLENAALRSALEWATRPADLT